VLGAHLAAQSDCRTQLVDLHAAGCLARPSSVVCPIILTTLTGETVQRYLAGPLDSHTREITTLRAKLLTWAKRSLPAAAGSKKGFAGWQRTDQRLRGKPRSRTWASYLVRAKTHRSDEGARQ